MGKANFSQAVKRSCFELFQHLGIIQKLFNQFCSNRHTEMKIETKISAEGPDYQSAEPLAQDLHHTT